MLGSWLRGEISSRKFLNLVYGLSNDSWFKTVLHQDLREWAAERERAAVDTAQSRIGALLSGEARLAEPWDQTVEKRSVRSEVG